ncbi:MAG: hypothetical protein IKH00_02785 [Bacteroidales bacterium]|nr:hypothetical protein [Bacteroidales bacterium]
MDTYCAEHQISQSQYLDEHNIPRHQYYVWKRKYRQGELCPGGEFVLPMMPPAKTSGKAKAKTGSVENRESFLTVEIRTAPTPCPHLARTSPEPFPNLARCPRIGPTCHAFPAEPRPVSLNWHHLERFGVKQTVLGLCGVTLRAKNGALLCLKSI